MPRSTTSSSRRSDGQSPSTVLQTTVIESISSVVLPSTGRYNLPLTPPPGWLLFPVFARSLRCFYRHYFVVSSFGLLQGGTITVRIGKVRH